MLLASLWRQKTSSLMWHSPLTESDYQNVLEENMYAKHSLSLVCICNIVRSNRVNRSVDSIQHWNMNIDLWTQQRLWLGTWFYIIQQNNEQYIDEELINKTWLCRVRAACTRILDDTLRRAHTTHAADTRQWTRYIQSCWWHAHYDTWPLDQRDLCPCVNTSANHWETEWRHQTIPGALSRERSGP